MLLFNELIKDAKSALTVEMVAGCMNQVLLDLDSNNVSIIFCRDDLPDFYYPSLSMAEGCGRPMEEQLCEYLG